MNSILLNMSKLRYLILCILLLLQFVHSDIIQEIKSNNYEGVKKSIDDGAELNYKITDKYKASPLTYAILQNNTDIVRLLLENGADPNSIPDYDFGDFFENYSPLMIAVYNNNLKITQLLVEYNANINHNEDLTSAIILAVLNKNEIILKYLLEHGASLEYDNIVFRGYIEKFKHKFWGNTVVTIAARNLDYGILDILLSYGVNIDSHGQSPMTALMYAVEMNDSKMAHYLIDHGANINYVPIYYDKFKPALEIAAVNGSYEIMNLLLNNGADVNIQNHKKQIPFDCAIFNLDFKSAAILISHGINIFKSYIFRNFILRFIFVLIIWYIIHFKRKRNIAEFLLMIYPVLPKNNNILVDSIILLSLIYFIGKDDVRRYLKYLLSEKTEHDKLLLYNKKRTLWDTGTDFVPLLIILSFLILALNIYAGNIEIRGKGDYTEEYLLIVEAELLISIVTTALMILRRPVALLGFLFLLPVNLFFPYYASGTIVYLLYIFCYIKSNKKFKPFSMVREGLGIKDIHLQHPSEISKTEKPDIGLRRDDDTS